MSLLSSKFQLSNPLLASTSNRGDSSGSLGLLATKRKASSDSQAQRSIPSKQKTGGMSLYSSGSLLLGSSLLGSGKVGGRADEKAMKPAAVPSSLLCIKSPLMENKLLSSTSSTSLTLQNKLLGSSGSSAFGQRLTSSAKPSVSSTYPHQKSSTSSSVTQGSLLVSKASSLRGQQKSHSPRDIKRAISTGPATSKKIKVEQTQDVILDASLTTCTLPDYNFSRELPVTKLDQWESAPSFDRLDEVASLKAEVRGRSKIAIKVKKKNPKINKSTCIHQ